MSPHRAPHVTMWLAAVLFAGCRSGESARPAATTPAAAASSEGSATDSAAANVVTVTASDYAFDAPAEIPAGLTTFKLVNRGPSIHHIQLIKLSEGKSANDFVAALKAGGPPPRWAALAGGPNPPETGGTATAVIPLEAGTYAIVCLVPAADGTPHVMKGMVRSLKVTGPARAGTEPTADIVVKLVDFDFQLSQPLTAGHHTLRIENNGAQPHEIAIVRLNPGKTPMDFANWGEKQVGPAPGALYGGISGIMPGAHAFAVVDLPPGDYGLLCFFPDGKDGKPHFVHGMSKLVKVS